MQSFIGGSIRLGQRQGFPRWNRAQFKSSAKAYLPSQSSSNAVQGTNNSIKSPNNHLLQFLGTTFVSQANGVCSVPVLSPLAAMMSSSSSIYMTTAAFPNMHSSEPFPDVPTRIKFKRLDKTAKHIMQECSFFPLQRDVPEIKPGYIVQLKVEVPENKRRLSTIKGIVIARRNAGLNTTFRIRRMVAGVGVESLFPLYSPNIKEIKVLDKKKVRRAKLYYLRNKMNALR
ncbi:50S ribosomal protein L19-2 [Hibiscus syriacus]|uniref:50S ribosomal protein L19-2 n=1 Tax=Hibiscus syriacus TaxID=106335 RepID=A0A6A2Z4E0_HIBSY|nr:50S ribosomal protein L19-2 [Hibiscus syriacus]